jgi:MIP family channel proteins
MASSGPRSSARGNPPRRVPAPAAAQAVSPELNETLTKAVAEFVGTFALIYIGVLVLVAGGPALFDNGTKDLVAVALAHGLTIAVMVSATMSISGGQLNPAVTAALLATRRISLTQGGVNILAQLLGGVVGALLAKLSVDNASTKAGVPELAAKVGAGQGILVEAVLTFFLVSAVFATLLDGRFNGRIGGLAVGFTVALDILAGGPITGAAMNPARWFGPALIENMWGDTWIYIVGPLVGGVLAGLLWHYVLLPRRR